MKIIRVVQFYGYMFHVYAVGRERKHAHMLEHVLLLTLQLRNNDLLKDWKIILWS